MMLKSENNMRMLGIAQIAGRVLQSRGYEACLVGGAVRDLAMSMEIHDVDLATNATPEQVYAIFNEQAYHAFFAGESFGVLTVQIDGTPVQIATYRKDGTYVDGRRPDSVQHYGVSIEDDLARRDFTMNAMAMKLPSMELIDLFNGREDIIAGMIRAVGDPTERFQEDGLRVLRAARFSAQTGFGIEPETFDAMCEKRVHNTLQKVAKERVREEVLKALGSAHPELFVQALEQAGLLRYALPFLEYQIGVKQGAMHKYDVYTHEVETLKEMAKLTESPFLRYVALAHDIGKTKEGEESGHRGHDKLGAIVIRAEMEQFKFSAEEVARASSLISNHLYFYNPDMSDAAIRRWVKRTGSALVGAQVMLAIADLRAHATPEMVAQADRYAEFKARLVALDTPEPSTRELELNGHDLMEYGLVGAQVGAAQRYLVDIVTADPLKNDEQTLRALLQPRLQEFLTLSTKSARYAE